jgi:predicted nucleotidyltransferase component of viral defense system
MDFYFLQSLSKELKIDIERLTREYWEMMVLREISQSKIGDFLIFGGGTALRLAFGSPRFSDDLDFYLRKKLSFSLFKKEIEKISQKLNLKITDLYNKFYTLLAEFQVKEDFLPLPFKLKIEVRKKIMKKGYETRLLFSPCVNFQVLLYALEIQKLKEFKEKTLKERKDPRDLFDLWFISQKLKEPFKKPKIKIERKKIKQTLSKFLPLDYKGVIEELSK